MQEIAIILSSIAGVATAAAARKMPRNKTQLLSLGASSHIRTQINSLKIEKDILTKTISRLYQTDYNFPKIQKDKLLLKYQHQLGIVLAKLEKLEDASHHPDLGPIGDGLITLMDQKLSRLDDRLYELSSKIIAANPHTSEIKEESMETKPEAKQNKKIFNFEKPKETKIDPIIIPQPNSRQSFELTTLTRFSNKEPKFPLFEKVVQPKEEIIQEIIKPKEEIKVVQPKIEDKIEIIQEINTKPEIKLETKPDINKEVVKITEHKALPEPKKSNPTIVLDDDFDEDNSDDLDKIKGEIMKVLSKIEQAEVE
ncbi:hypothetical protein [Nitrosarchaeum koreense]|uniref:Uncharacterized protein n=1 Tax=Nitrosarchaeum koreense MY1 TaxID=1001994 RepID=F9CYY3_9ARCH|nr:hypothetical protein [Nitrosarchaeum koreense]EGP92951.1 hypothetical protein MY1_0168 [Nitrosarchaeum koreense MY1]